MVGSFGALSIITEGQGCEPEGPGRLLLNFSLYKSFLSIFRIASGLHSLDRYAYITANIKTFNYES